MSFTKEQQLMASDSTQLDTLIADAIKKVNGKKENDICHYLPAKQGGYLHHFTLKKMKTEEPSELLNLINSYILAVEEPQAVQPKPRAARGSRKRRSQIAFTKQELERMLQHASAAGDDEIIRKLIPIKDLKTIKKELIASIRRNEVDLDLFERYKQAVQNQAASLEAVTAGNFF